MSIALRDMAGIVVMIIAMIASFIFGFVIGMDMTFKRIKLYYGEDEWRRLIEGLHREIYEEEENNESNID